jgi:hypothetical protein
MIGNLPTVAAVDVQIEELERTQAAYIEAHATQVDAYTKA